MVGRRGFDRPCFHSCLPTITQHTMLLMRRLAPFLSSVLLANSFAGPLQAQTSTTQSAQQLYGPRVTLDVLSDVKGVQLDAYRKELVLELEHDLSGKLNALGVQARDQQEVELVLTIESAGNLSSLRLGAGTQDTPMARATWKAVKDAKYTALPHGLNNSSLRISVHVVAS